MASSAPPQSTIATLSPRELEILHLLATGHTAKSIAARLGRSEASINERLREARRKTGVGSSRELARLVDAQKNRDRKIDLSPASEAGDQPTRSPMLGTTWLKGITIMAGLLAIVAAALALQAPAPVAPAASDRAGAVRAPLASPLLGRWALDTSRIPADERPRSVTLEFAATPEGKWHGTVNIVGPDGSAQQAESLAEIGGPPVALTGNMRFADTVALRQPAPGTLVMTFEKGGSQVSTRVYTIEGDGNAMKETIVWAGAADPRMVTTYFKRVE